MWKFTSATLPTVILILTCLEEDENKEVDIADLWITRTAAFTRQILFGFVVVCPPPPNANTDTCQIWHRAVSSATTPLSQKGPRSFSSPERVPQACRSEARTSRCQPGLPHLPSPAPAPAGPLLPGRAFKGRGDRKRAPSSRASPGSTQAQRPRRTAPTPHPPKNAPASRSRSWPQSQPRRRPPQRPLQGHGRQQEGAELPRSPHGGPTPLSGPRPASQRRAGLPAALPVSRGAVYPGVPPRPARGRWLPEVSDLLTAVSEVKAAQSGLPAGKERLRSGGESGAQPAGSRLWGGRERLAAAAGRCYRLWVQEVLTDRFFLRKNRSGIGT